MFNPRTNTPIHYFTNDFRLKLSEDDHKIVGNLSYYELLQKLERNEVKIEDLNERILRRLQVVDLVTRQGTFNLKNISIPTDNFLYNFNEFSKFQVTIHSSVNIRSSAQDTAVSEILTEHGLCFTYNLAAVNDIYNVDAELTADFFHDYFLITFKSPNLKETVPRKVKASALVSVSASAFPYFYDEIYNGRYDGHLIYIHSPYELPTESSNQIFLQKDTFLKAQVEPQLNVVDVSLEDLDIKERNCYLEHEKKLKFFKVYTKTNCEHECMADNVLNRCSCVEFFMIRNFTTRICSANEKNCFDAARVDFEEHKSDCGCLQPCNYVKYDVETVQTSFESHTYTYHGIYCNIVFAFIKNHYNELVRKKQFNEVDFLSFVGGLLGLFAGFSALSFIEVIYWILSRLKLMILKHKNSIYPTIVHVTESNQQINTRGTKSLIKEYFAESSIHGFNYILNSKTIETVFWIFAFIFSISLCSTLISQTNQKLPDSRVISLDENLKSIDKIPFPAISYNPYRFVDKYFVDQLNSILNQAYFRLKLDANESLKEEFTLNITRYQSCYGGIWHQVRTLLIEPKGILHELRRDMSKVEFFRDQFALFNQKLSVNFSEGYMGNFYAYTFNMMDFEDIFRADEISNAIRYSRNISMKQQNDFQALPSTSYPIHMNIKDKMFEFTLKLNKQPELNDPTLMPCGITSFFIHNIETFPVYSFNAVFLDIVPGFIFNVDVAPEITTTDKSLSSLSPQTRDCYFDNEKYLKYFKIYSLRNCENECMSNYTFKACGCNHWRYPYNEKAGHNYCYKVKDVDCALSLYTTLMFSDYFSPQLNCSCLPTCNSITYNIKYHAEHDDENPNLTTINVRMRTEETILYRRYQQFTASDVVSYVGGLLGLFAGISMLSIVEIFYFFTIRLGVDFWRGLGGN
ncbi:hypothetical protein ACKWTF_015331 [Chironomus riparius]